MKTKIWLSILNKDTREVVVLARTYAELIPLKTGDFVNIGVYSLPVEMTHFEVKESELNHKLKSLREPITSFSGVITYLKNAGWEGI